MNVLLEQVRRYFRPTLDDDLETQVRGILRQYVGRAPPRLRVFVSNDRLPPGAEPNQWSREEAEHLTSFANRWAEDNSVRARTLAIEVVMLDTIREFAWVKALRATDTDGVRGGGAQPIASTHVPRSLAELEITGAEPRVVQVRDDVVVGRGSGDEVIDLADNKVSHRHAAFRLRQGILVIADLGSRNGTQLNGVRLEPQREVKLKVGDVVAIGSCSIRVTRAP